MNEVTGKNFEETVKNNKLVILDCRASALFFECKKVFFGKVDEEKELVKSGNLK